MRARGFVTAVIPFRMDSDPVEALLKGAVEPGTGNQPATAWKHELDKPPRMIHFLSLAVVDPRSPMDDFTPASRDGVSLLVIEATSDTGASETLWMVARALDDLLIAVLDRASPEGWMHTTDIEQLARFLVDHHVVIGDEWGQSMGQVHDGSPGMSLERILAEERLAHLIGRFINQERMLKDPNWLKSSPTQRLDTIRNHLWSGREQLDGDAVWAFIPEPTPVLQAAPDGAFQKESALLSIVYKLLWPLYLPLTILLLQSYFRTRTDASWPHGVTTVFAFFIGLLVLGLLWWLRPPRHHPFTSLVVPAFAVFALFESFVNAAHWFYVYLAVLTVLTLIATGAGYWHLRQREKSDPADDETPNRDDVRALMTTENYCPQNHMFTISTIKPGLLRWYALRVILTMIGSNNFVSRPGFLGKNGVIHAARWLWIRDTKLHFFRWFDAGRLIFWSNFDGTWESYVGDFVADSPDGVTGLWSNCLGFPRAKNLTDEGAKNRDRLVRWARRQQKPTTFWYSAYPSLTNARIRINAAIRQGIASAQTDGDARDWLSLFGSQPRPRGSLITNQIPALIFGVLPSLPEASCFMLNFRGTVEERRAWLDRTRASVTFGEVLPGQTSAVMLSLSVCALKRLGVPDNAIRTFPVAFQEGMWTPARARALGDEHENDPSHWVWGAAEKREPPDPDETTDLFMVIYGKNETDVDAVRTTLFDDTAAVHVVRSQLFNRRSETMVDKHQQSHPTAQCPHTTSDQSRYQKEGFGFADNVSQPIIRGLRRSDTRTAHNDLVGPGEFVLGYPDGLDRIPPTPLIDPSEDPYHVLADNAPLPEQRPEFSQNGSSGYRDLGANGTFLVVRDLEQHVDRWKKMLDDESERIRKTFLVSVGDGGVAIVWGEPLPAHELIDPAKIAPAIAAKLLGRWQDGSTLVRYPMVPGGEAASLDNSFRFGVEDPQGLSCPLGAHTRRANPRDTRFPKSQEEIDSVNRHRLLRVGRSYKFDNGKRTGLMFMCLNADIERQFEFVQKTWLLNRNMSGLENETDPLIGPGNKFSIPTPGGIVQLHVPKLSTVRGGGYFFMPGKATLTFLATMGRNPVDSPSGGGPLPEGVARPDRSEPTVDLTSQESDHHVDA